MPAFNFYFKNNSITGTTTSGLTGGIKRTSLKEADIAFVEETFGITVNDDEADAICIGFAHNKKSDNEINWG